MRKIILLLITSLIMVLLISAALSPSQDFNMTWWSVDSGGGSCGGGDFSLNGTIGQTDTDTMTGGEFTLAGGISPGEAVLLEVEIYLPLLKR